MTSNRLKSDARQYMNSHPGVSYQEALRKVGGTPLPNNSGVRVRRPEADNITKRSGAQANSVIQNIDDLIGLDEFKDVLHTTVALSHVEDELARRGETTQARQLRPRLNFAFAGEAGTGKSAAAHALTRELFTLGLIEREHLAHIDYSHLCNAFVAGTHANTRAALNEALGGVAVVNVNDLHGQPPDSLRLEALSTILGFVADPDPQQTVLIFTGYERSLHHLYNTYPLLKKQLRHISFPSFTPAQLWQLLDRRVQQVGRRLGPGIREEFVALATDLCEKTDPHGRTLIDVCGNAWFTNCVVDVAQELADTRLITEMPDPADFSSLSDEQLVELRREDIRAAAQLVATHRGSDEVNIVLLDSKGGAAFRGDEKLPHVSANTSNPDNATDQVSRAAVVIRSEIRKREILMGYSDGVDVVEHRQKGANEPAADDARAD